MTEKREQRNRHPLNQRLSDVYTLIIAVGLVAGYEMFGGEYPTFDEQVVGIAIGTRIVRFINTVIEEIVWVLIAGLLTCLKFHFQVHEKDK
ncbi:MAG: hypothetical protein AAF702_47595 [Chloroflexota bacterium]